MNSLDIFYIMFFLNCLLLLFRLNNILIILFAFEFMVVNLLFAFIYLSVPFDPISLLVFLAVVAGEASLGLSLLVSVLRQSGNDNILNPSIDSFEGF
uniref:NADH-ubiquinone oxidoreductase chain 4L n=1 Tax=Hoploplana elisabelloi TaxID=1714492 RepID=A0A0P0CJ57_9PLAT|nr:NADH dehydrogenase subunit 4L [Hoploplana elisabelloi]BEU28619.1 NADH dehydrogenase subunit 4L [Planocera cf. pellucida MK-2019C]ALI86947.1 NADH dehydrogenase subunit 4L [Hoploplana elisabelloi]BEU28631.1 NADH dehydrogenase subunit 4L [Planocera cf. pellucida MK-2019C]BEU28643.1 NADH dehydrogenase subunit 4L [Planocera cf. pellucida MK-2019C]BEU28655.1 NADH dehydrogenase subunit 4L [Planocera cf. pellucida MK-2019C]